MNRFKIHSFMALGLFLFAAQPCVWAMAKRPAAEEIRSETPAAKKEVTLDEAYRLSLSRSETIAIAREEIAKAHADWLRATGEAIGDGDFVSTDFFQQDQGSGDSGGSSVGSTFIASERRERKFTFSQPIFQGFKSLGALTGAGSLTRQRKEEYKRSKEVLFLEVVQFYYNLMQQKKDLETFEGIRNLLEERIRDLQGREKIGRSRASEVVTAQSKLKILEAQLAETRGALKIVESVMTFYTGIPEEQAEYKEPSISMALPEEPADFKTLAEKRHDVEASRQKMKLARRAMLVAQSALWPKITLDANQYEKREGFQSGIDWDVLFKVNVPLFRGGSTLGNIKAVYSDYKQAKWNYARTQREAELAVKEAYQNWASAIEQNKALRQAMKASQENYNLQKEEYARSLVNNLDVLSALEELFTTSREANRVHYKMKKNYWQYQTSLGECCSAPSAELGKG